MPESPSPLRQAYRFFRWIILLVLVLVIVVALRKPAPPAAALPPENAQEKLADFNSKLDELAAAHARGEAGEARFSGDEINSAVASSMAEAPAASTGPDTSELPVKTVEVAFIADQVIGQFTTQIYGKEVYITLAGRLGSHDGYATFEPSEFKVGQLSVPLALVNDTLQKKLAEPANHEKLKLPEYISSLRVEDGQ